MTRAATRQRLRLSGGTELSFITAGEASMPAVLLLHGSPSSAAAVSLMRDFIRHSAKASEWDHVGDDPTTVGRDADHGSILCHAERV